MGERAAVKLRLDRMVIQQGRLAEQKQNLGKDEMLNIIKHGAKAIFANKDDDTIELDIDTLLETGEKKTEAEKKKMDELGESNLRAFTLDTKPEDSVYNFEGEDFREKCKDDATLEWIAPPKRERKNVYASVLNFNEFFKAASVSEGNEKVQRLPRPPNQP